jgi:hypothetical protein
MIHNILDHASLLENQESKAYKNHLQQALQLMPDMRDVTAILILTRLHEKKRNIIYNLTITQVSLFLCNYE